MGIKAVIARIRTHQPDNEHITRQPGQADETRHLGGATLKPGHQKKVAADKNDDLHQHLAASGQRAQRDQHRHQANRQQQTRQGTTLTEQQQEHKTGNRRGMPGGDFRGAEKSREWFQDHADVIHHQTFADLTQRRPIVVDVFQIDPGQRQRRNHHVEPHPAGDPGQVKAHRILIGKHDRWQRRKISEQTNRRHRHAAKADQRMRRLRQHQQHKQGKRRADLLAPSADGIGSQGHPLQQRPDPGSAEHRPDHHHEIHRLIRCQLAHRVLQNGDQRTQHQPVAPGSNRHQRHQKQQRKS